MTIDNHKRKKTALITGPAGNLGRSVVDKFYRAGMKLILVDRHPDRILNLFSTIDTSEHLLIPALDLTAASSANEIRDRLSTSRSRIDYLIHTVGGYQAGETVHQITPDNWNHMMAVNVLSFLNITKAVLPGMIDHQSGRIITIGAKPSLKGRASMGAYSASKAALLRLTEAISAEQSDTGIIAHCLIPGTIDTPENRQAMPRADRSRWVTPDRIAEKIYNICLDKNPSKEVIIPL